MQELNALPDCYAKQIRAIGKNSVVDDFSQLQDDVPHEYLLRILKRAENVSSGEETIILSEQLEGDDND